MATIYLAHTEKSSTLCSDANHASTSMNDTGEELDCREACLAESAYLVARGGRPLGLAGHCPSEGATMRRMAFLVESHAEPGAIPFLADRGDGFADYGYAASKWAIALFRWAQSDAVPT